MLKSYLGRTIYDHSNWLHWGVVYGGGEKCLLVRNPETGRRYRIFRADMRRGRPRTTIPPLRIFRSAVFEAPPAEPAPPKKTETLGTRGLRAIPIKGIRE